MQKITIIGTSHISPDSVKKARQTILRRKPDCVAIELCPERYQALLEGRTHPPSIKTPLYYLLYHIQQHLGKETGVSPGSEMLTAVDAAKKVGAKIALIDIDVGIIMNEMSKIPKMERFSLVIRLIGSMLISPILELLPSKKAKFDIKKVPEDGTIEEAMQYLKKELPSFYKILVEDRNIYMAEWIKKLAKMHRRIIVVVGAGHKKGLERLLRKRKK